MASLQAEITKLDTWLDANYFHPAHDNVQRIRIKLASALQHTRHIQSYTQDAIAVNQCLTNFNGDTLTALQTRAHLTIGATSPERKALGIAMMAAGISLLVLSFLVITTVLSCTFPLAGFFLLLGGTASFTFGIGFFKSGLQQGMASELSGLHQILCTPNILLNG